MLRCLPVGTPAQEAAITVMMDAAVTALLRRGWDVGVDATHIQPGALAHWRDLGAAAGAEIHVLDITDVPVEECVRRDASRAAGGGRLVGEAVIREMASRWLEDARREVRGRPKAASQDPD